MLRAYSEPVRAYCARTPSNRKRGRAGLSLIHQRFITSEQVLTERTCSAPHLCANARRRAQLAFKSGKEAQRPVRPPQPPAHTRTARRRNSTWLPHFRRACPRRPRAPTSPRRNATATLSMSLLVKNVNLPFAKDNFDAGWGVLVAQAGFPAAAASFASRVDDYFVTSGAPPAIPSGPPSRAALGGSASQRSRRVARPFPHPAPTPPRRPARHPAPRLRGRRPAAAPVAGAAPRVPTGPRRGRGGGPLPPPGGAGA